MPEIRHKEQVVNEIERKNPLHAAVILLLEHLSVSQPEAAKEAHILQDKLDARVGYAVGSRRADFVDDAETGDGGERADVFAQTGEALKELGTGMDVLNQRLDNIQKEQAANGVLIEGLVKAVDAVKQRIDKGDQERAELTNAVSEITKQMAEVDPDVKIRKSK